MIWIIFLGTLAISLLASGRVKANYLRFSQVPTSRGLTGAQAAQAIMQRAGIHDVEVMAQDGFLGDHYDPMHKRLVLSTDNYFGASVAAVGVAAHVAPADSSAASFELKPGEVVRAGKEYGSFVRIIAPDGRAGWIRETSIESIIPCEAKTIAAN